MFREDGTRGVEILVVVDAWNTAVGGIVDQQTEHFLVHAQRLGEVCIRKLLCVLVLATALREVVVARAGVELGEQEVHVGRRGVARTAGAAKVVGDILAEAEGLDRVTTQVAGADEKATEVVQRVLRPGALGTARVPEEGEEPL